MDHRGNCLSGHRTCMVVQAYLVEFLKDYGYTPIATTKFDHNDVALIQTADLEDRIQSG